MAEDNPKPKPRAGFGILLLKDGKVLLGKRHEDKDTDKRVSALCSLEKD